RAGVRHLIPHNNTRVVDGEKMEAAPGDRKVFHLRIRRHSISTTGRPEKDVPPRRVAVYVGWIRKTDYLAGIVDIPGLAVTTRDETSEVLHPRIGRRSIRASGCPEKGVIGGVVPGNDL